MAPQESFVGIEIAEFCNVVSHAEKYVGTTIIIMTTVASILLIASILSIPIIVFIVNYYY